MNSELQKPDPQLVSRIAVTWIELTAVGLAGGIFGSSVGGPPGLIIYFITTLISVGVIFYNVNELIKRWMTYGPISEDSS